ncbi:leucine-rich repeat, immunoglobulin-like domain and transmembrane domain-containing protein 3b [Rhinichthys klamathensis goyatoka]|uniref:leucine-rich repeat, immunoglobulin-like domain and transmembrane domain-containing protein 3b n=1 Tax=Rhinichthys klamathensis goyatoka TaxID=3034132 RepID=UPI0024B48A87|nr:leucine-rich repeat, immunoglobulin-like domain and transmembrane domain-containing protein 3b [Rhinichthys klamathensis goyatoka]
MHPVVLYADLTLCLALVVCAQSPSCPSLCTCVLHDRSNSKGLRTVLCKNPALTAIPIDLPSDTVKFRLERTSVSRIFRGAFSAMPELLYLWLTYNSITVLHPRSFTNLSSLHELRLDGNLLSTFPWEGLRDVPRLRTLGLHNNRLARIPPLAARYLGNVTYLDLSSNRLSTLPNDLIALWPLSDATQSQRSVVLGLQDNPWVCDCRLSTLLDISKAPESSLVLLDRFLTCSGPPDLAGVPFQSVELTRCRRPYAVTSATKITALLGSNVLLRCDATGHPTPTIMWIKSARPDLYNQDVHESPRVGIRWSAVSLNGISYRDAGEYRCRAQNMAGISEAIVSLNVVGIMGEYANSKNSGRQQTVAKSDYSQKKPKQKSKAIPSLLPRNMTGKPSLPKRVIKIPKASRDKMKRDRTAVQNLPQKHFLIPSENPLHKKQTPHVSMSILT